MAVARLSELRLPRRRPLTDEARYPVVEKNAATMLVTFRADPRQRAVVAEALGDAGAVVHLDDCAEDDRRAALASADLVLSKNIGDELRPDDFALLEKVRLLQCLSAGVDFLPLRALPPALPVAANRGGYSEPIAEHALAMALAASKRLLVEHANLLKGEFNQFTPNRMLAGGVCGILGFGGIGKATARLFRAIGMRIHAVNRSGQTDEEVEWIGTIADLDAFLAACDVLVIAAPLTRTTRNLIGGRALKLMKSDAILVNVARGEIVEEVALGEHLRATPGFTACLEAWWVEPIRHGGRMVLDQELLALPNVIGAPHNSATVTGWREEIGLRRAVENCRRVLQGHPPENLVTEDERVR